MRRLVAATAVLATCVGGAAVNAAGPQVLLVGTWHGIAGDYASIQSAVDAAQPGDWILVGPGDWKERGDYTSHPPEGDEPGAAVEIATPWLHLRGMDRNAVVVDGTKPGTPTCSSAAADQDLGPGGVGRNGVVADAVDGVTIENLTACNFLGEEGNQIWWNGGDGTGVIGMNEWWGGWLSATTTYFDPNGAAAAYGLFVSNARGPGRLHDAYANNMNDSSFYVGACADCNAVLDHVHAQNSALGLSSTNAGGHLVVENSEWDHNATGMVTNSQNNDDAPPPQEGACPDNGTGPTGTHSCTVWRGNYVHDNNNPNVPQAGTASIGPVGTGMVIAGGRDDTVVGNRVEHNGAWGILTTPYPDFGPPPPVTHCEGGVSAGDACYFGDWGIEVARNRLSGNGFFGNPTNGDLADLSDPHNPGNCWHDNTDPAGVTTEPPLLQVTHATCGIPNSGDPLTSTLGLEVACDTGAIVPCPPTPVANYPQSTGAVLMPLPRQPSMPNPCRDTPANPWCPSRSGGVARPDATPPDRRAGKPHAS